jgi:hypothetical protein
MQYFWIFLSLNDANMQYATLNEIQNNIMQNLDLGF